MKCSLKKGFSFGLSSGIITTLGLMVGLNSSTGSTSVVIGGILVIAIADAMSDALGIHISEESENQHSEKEIWAVTIMTLFSKFIFSAMFIIPVIFLPLALAIKFSVVVGIFLIAIYSYHLAKKQKTKPYKVIGEHLLIAIMVVVITHYIGLWAATLK